MLSYVFTMAKHSCVLRTFQSRSGTELMYMLPFPKFLVALWSCWRQLCWMYQAEDRIHNPPFDISAYLKSELAFMPLPRQEIHNLGGSLLCFTSLSVNVCNHSHPPFLLGMGLLPCHCRVDLFSQEGSTLSPQDLSHRSYWFFSATSSGNQWC